MIRNGTIMKKMGLLAALLLLVVSAKADERVIELKQLPRAAQEFLERHFDTVEVSAVWVDRDLLDNDYKVLFADGSSVEFDRQGAWVEVDAGRGGTVPEVIIPKQIRRSIDERFGGRTVRKIDRDRRGYEVELSNGLSLEYNHRYRLLEVDD